MLAGFFGFSSRIFCWLDKQQSPGNRLPGGALHIFRVRGRAIGKDIYFPDIGIKNGINFHNFGIRMVPIFRILV